MANLQQFIQNNFSTGLNTTDSTLSIKNSDLRKANNVIFERTGEVKSLDGLTQIGDNMEVNSLPVEKILGGCIFQKTVYLLASNGLISRILWLDGVLWKQANATNFDASANAEMLVYQNKIWIVNGKKTGNYVVVFLDTTNTITGIETSSGLPEGVNRIALHLERIWIAHKNQIYVSRQYPQGTNNDWDNSSVYTGANTAGLIQLDDNTEDEILQMVDHFGQLVVFREETIKVVSGQTVLTSTIHKAFNSRGVYAYRSIAKADSSIYLFAPEGVKVFQGITVKEGTTEFDSIETDTIDRAIKFNIDNIKTRDFVGYSYKDHYYLTDTVFGTYILNEITGGWSLCDLIAPVFFLEYNGELCCCEQDKFYKFNDNASADVISEVITKDFDLQIPNFYKLFEKVILYLRTYTFSSDVTFSWYIDGAGSPTGSVSLVIGSDAILMDGSYAMDGSIRMNNISINFNKKTLRKLMSGSTIAFGIKCSGTNRFFLNAIVLIYEIMRREIR